MSDADWTEWARREYASSIRDGGVAVIPPATGDDSRCDYVKGVLDDALVIVAELGVPADLAPVALAKAIDLLASAE